MKLLLVIFLLLLFVSGIGMMLFMLVRKLDPNRGDKSEAKNLSIAQDFLPFDDIRDGLIILPNHNYRAVIECASLNYDLKTEGEREQIEMSFQQFINSLSFPISFFLQTKEIDNSHRIEALKEDVKKTLVEFPAMKTYAEQFVKDMENLSARIGNNQQKKRYIVISYDDAAGLEQLSDGEKATYAMKELVNRCNSIRSGLEAAGIISHRLDTAELIELVYSCYNRDNFSFANAIASREAFALFIDGEKDRFRDLPRIGMLDLILGETINRIRTNNIDEDKTGKAVLEQLETMRQKYAGYFEEGGF